MTSFWTPGLVNKHRLERSLKILVRLNEARRINQPEAVEMLEDALNEHDLQCGYDRRANEALRLKYLARQNARNVKTDIP